MLEQNPIFQNALQMKQIEAELKLLTGFERGQVQLLATTTGHSWASALEAVKSGDFRRQARAAPICTAQVASLNLPTPNKPKGRRRTRRQRKQATS